VRSFDKQAVFNQLAQQNYQIPVDLLFPYTAGNPHLANALAEHIDSWSKAGSERIDRAWIERHQGPLSQIMRAGEQQMLESVPEALLPILDAISPLRFYRLEALRSMLVAQGLESPDRPDGYYLNILRGLDQKTEIVWWDRKRRAYVTSIVIRQLIGRRQLIEDPSAYISRQQRAIEMYWALVREYPKASEDFIGEIWFHLGSLQMATHDIQGLRKKVFEALAFARDNLNRDRLLVVQQIFDERDPDRELLDLLPDNLRRELVKELDRLVNEKTD